jgi:hypothetical protein
MSPKKTNSVSIRSFWILFPCENELVLKDILTATWVSQGGDSLYFSEIDLFT